MKAYKVFESLFVLVLILFVLAIGVDTILRISFAKDAVYCGKVSSVEFVDPIRGHSYVKMKLSEHPKYTFRAPSSFLDTQSGDMLRINAKQSPIRDLEYPEVSYIERVQNCK